MAIIRFHVPSTLKTPHKLVNPARSDGLAAPAGNPKNKLAISIFAAKIDLAGEFFGVGAMSEYIKRFLKPSDQTYFLFGPRGTGKSTWLKFYYPEALRIDLLKPEPSGVRHLHSVTDPQMALNAIRLTE